MAPAAVSSATLGSSANSSAAQCQQQSMNPRATQLLTSCPTHLQPAPFYGMPPPFMMMPFGRMPFPMMPGMLPPAGNSKGMPPMPMPPMMFPHPAQLHAMSQAAQAAMAQAAKQPGSMPPFFPMPMMPPMPLMQQPAAPGMQSSTPPQQAGHPAQPAAAAGQPAGQAGAVEDDEEDVAVDEVVEVEPELEQIFETVAAMEREKVQRQQQHGSPCGSMNSSHPCNVATAAPIPAAPTPAAAFNKAATAPPAGAACAPDAAPVPWLSFATDDKQDDLDADLAQLITLPVDLSNGSPIGSPAAAARRSVQLKRVSSTGSAYSCGEVIAGAAVAGLTGRPAAAVPVPDGKPAAVAKGSKPKVLRIRSIKGCSSAPKPASGAKSNARAPAGPARKSGSSKAGNSPQNAAAAATGLGPAKAGVQKKSGNGGNSSSKAKSKAAGQPTATVEEMKQQQLEKQLPAASDDLSLLGDLESGLSDTCFGGADDMGIDSLDYLGDLLQEASEDGWDGLLGGMTSGEMELCSGLALN